MSYRIHDIDNHEETLGKNAEIRRILTWIYETKMNFFLNYVRAKGIPKGDEHTVINETYMSFDKLGPRKDIAELLQKEELTELGKKKLTEALTALFVWYLKRRCDDFHRKKRKGAIIYIEDERDLLEKIPAPVTGDEAMRTFLFSLSLPPEIDIEKCLQDDRETIIKLIEIIAERANLNKKEKAFVLFKVEHPELRDQDFDPNLTPDRISKIKKSALGKIMAFLEIY